MLSTQMSEGSGDAHLRRAKLTAERIEAVLSNLLVPFEGRIENCRNTAEDSITTEMCSAAINAAWRCLVKHLFVQMIDRRDPMVLQILPPLTKDAGEKTKPWYDERSYIAYAAHYSNSLDRQQAKQFARAFIL